MNPLFSSLALVLVLAQVVLPLRLAFLPLLVAVCHLPNISVLGVGGGDFSITRVLIGVGLIRAVVSRVPIRSPRHPLDIFVAVWSCFAVLTSFAHSSEDSNPLVFSLGLVYNAAGTYLYARAYVKDLDSFALFIKCLVAVLLPLALLMMLENVTGQNFYAVLGGGIDAQGFLREGRIRAQGAFAHPILAGTVGASSLLLALGLWHQDRRLAITGAVACVVITLSSSSSGPLMTLFAGLVALGLWRWRTNLRGIRWCVFLLLVCLHFTMKVPVWYLIARMDIVGGSTGWHRAELITAGLEHLNEWWLAGTDYTVHWMPTGVSWSPNHTDITNHYLAMGVNGGLPLMLTFIAILLKCFQSLGRRMAELRDADDPSEFVLWLVGGAIFAHSLTFLSISYFDQTNALIWIVVGIVPGICSAGTSAGDGSTPNEEELAAPQPIHFATHS
ncbi:MAG TPA: O-antigen ligase family protein [Terrimicrobiaceae bacterium]